MPRPRLTVAQCAGTGVADDKRKKQVWFDVSETWHPLVAEADFPAEGKLAARIAGWHVLVARTETGLFAVNDRCTHQAATLSGGRIRRGAVMCPLHGARFEMETGRCIGGAYTDLRVFPLRVADGMIAVCVPDSPPGMDEMPAMA
ncbi:MAG: Rieske (2Fe-2S) protein [Sphingopyxis sp.]